MEQEGGTVQKLTVNGWTRAARLFEIEAYLRNKEKRETERKRELLKRKSQGGAKMREGRAAYEICVSEEVLKQGRK